MWRTYKIQCWANPLTPNPAIGKGLGGEGGGGGRGGRDGNVKNGEDMEEENKEEE